MGLAHDLFVPLGPRRVGLVAADAGRVAAPVDIVLPGIAGVRFTRAMAGFAGQALVLVLRQFLVFIPVALLAGLLSGVNPGTRCQFRQRGPTIPPIFPERRRGQEVTSDRIGRHNPDRQQEDPE